MDNKTLIRTDLALEAKNNITEDKGLIKGIKVSEDYDEKNDINIIRMDVLNRYAAGKIGKPIGTYITMEVPHLKNEDEEFHMAISRALAAQLKRLIAQNYSWENNVPQILVAGLGNTKATPDALGPGVVSNLMITRHLIEYMGYDSVDNAFAVVSAIIPGVMAQTGMETSEIISAVVKKTSPDILIVIDALAARSLSRLNSTIQITNTGICPGSGVGNDRNAINKRTMGIPVIAVGIPTVVDGATLIYDSLERNKVDTTAINLAEYESMYITPKDIDATIKRESYTISEAINMCMTNE